MSLVAVLAATTTVGEPATIPADAPAIPAIPATRTRRRRSRIPTARAVISGRKASPELELREVARSVRHGRSVASANLFITALDTDGVGSERSDYSLPVAARALSASGNSNAVRWILSGENLVTGSVTYEVRDGAGVVQGTVIVSVEICARRGNRLKLTTTGAVIGHSAIRSETPAAGWFVVGIRPAPNQPQ